MFLIRYKTAWHWDDVALLKNIIRALPSDLLLGRSGFMFPFIWLWVFLRDVFGTGFLVVEDCIRIANMFFLTGAFILQYRVLIKMNVPVRIAFLTILFLLSEFSFSVISSRVADSALMYFCVLASYYFFILAYQQHRKKFLSISAFLFGYAFLVREPALLFFPGFIVLFLRFRTPVKFKLKEYVSAFTVFFTVCVFAPVAMALYYRDIYFETINKSITMGYSFNFSDMMFRLHSIWLSNINHITLPVAVVGLVIFIKKYGWRNFTDLAIFFLGPVLLAYFYSSTAIVIEPRIHFGTFLLIALGLAVLVDYVSSLVKNELLRKLILIASSVVVMVVTAIRFVPQYQEDLQKISHLESYYESIKPLLGRNVVIIIGNETLYVTYRGRVDDIGPFVVSPGWGWPKDRLVEIIRQSLLDNKTVIYDARTRSYNEAKRAKDLDEMAAAFNFTETKNGFIQVTLKK